MTNLVLEAALQLFTTQGYARTSIEQVAATAGAGKHTVYRRYASKAELFAAVIELQRVKFAQRIAAIKESAASPIEALEHMYRAQLELVCERASVDFHRVLLAESRLFPELAQVLAGGDSPALGRARELVAEAQRRHQLVQAEPCFLVNQLHQSLIEFPLKQLLLGDPRFQRKAARSDYFEKAWQLFMKGAAGRSARTESA